MEEQYEGARNMCLSEGADLAYILDSDMQDGLKDLIEKKKDLFPHFSMADYFWAGGAVSLQNEWSWLAHYQSFDKYSNWKSNIPGN